VEAGARNVKARSRAESFFKMRAYTLLRNVLLKNETLFWLTAFPVQ
jgi:hypothetical protein